VKRYLREYKWGFVFFMVYATCMLSYNIGTDGVAYEVLLWKEGNPATEKMVRGFYSMLDKNGICEHPECRVKVWQTEKNDGKYWWISVEPKGNWGVAEVRYPIIFLPKLNNDYLVVGRRIGQRLPMSYVERKGEMLPSWAYRNEMRGIPDLFNKKCIFWARWPSGEMTIQILAYENDNEGCMVWTQDSEGWIKDFVLSYEYEEAYKDKGYRAYIVHFPENTGQKGTGFESPYPVVTTPYKGGWYSAAQIYREWAIKQPWCAKGKIYNRPTTPEWFKNLHLWGGCAGDPAWVSKSNLPIIKEVSGGRCAGAQWMNWSRYFDAGVTSSPQYYPAEAEEEFKKLIGLKNEGIHLAPYFMFSVATAQATDIYSHIASSVIRNADGSIPVMYWHSPFEYYLTKWAPRGRLPEGYIRFVQSIVNYKKDLKDAWSQPLNEELIQRMDNFPMLESERERQKNLLRNNWGKDISIVENIKFYGEWHKTCLAHKPFADFCFEQVEKVMKAYEPDVIYFDTFPHSAIPCYDKEHGHPVGYGRYITHAAHDFCSRILEKYPSLILVCESGAGEHLLDVMHLTYHKSVLVEYAIPLFSTIYQGYLEYTNWWMWPPYDTTEQFVSALAYSIHLGYMPGGAVAGGIISQLGKDRTTEEINCDPKVKFLHKTMDIRNTYRDYVVAGRRLKDPVVSGQTPIEMVWGQDTAWYEKDKKIKVPPVRIKLCPVQASKWAKNGDEKKYILLLSNFSSEKQNVVVEGDSIEVEPFSWKVLERELK